MKKIILILCAGMVVLLSCEKEKTKSEPSDFHGTWLGTWTTNDNSMSGNFAAPASQSGDEVTGAVMVNVLFPEEVGYRPEFTGNIEGDEARVLFSAQGVDIQVIADLITENEIVGTFLVPGYYEGTFSGERYPLSVVNTSEVYAITTDNWYKDMYIINDQFWLLNYMTDQFEIIDQSGIQVGTQDAEFISYRSACSDGNYFWVYGRDYENPNNAVYQMTIEQEVLDSILVPEGMVDALSYNKEKEQLYCTFFESQKIYTVNPQGTYTDSMDIDFLYFSDFISYKDGFLVAASYSPYLFYLDVSGDIIESYAIDEGIYSLGEDQAGNIYCFTNQILFVGDDVQDTYRILKLYLE